MQQKFLGTIRIVVQSGKAMQGPPLGGLLGQKGLRAATFCKQFNEQALKYWVDGVPLPVCIKAYSDGTFEYAIKGPTTAHLITQILKKNELNGRVVSYKALYEVARLRQLDHKNVALIYIYMSLVGSCASMGVKLI